LLLIVLLILEVVQVWDWNSDLSHASSPFCSGYFGDRISHFTQAKLEGKPPILGFPL
jgi:hypothetical protein